EGELLARVRRRRPGLPIVVALDFHANVSRAMIENTHALVAYRSYPHVDMADTGRRAAALLACILAGETLHCAWRRLPFVIPMPWQSTLADPGAHLLDVALSLQNDSVRLAQFIPGFPLADIQDCGPSVLVYASTATWAARAADTLYEEALRARTGFGGRLLSVDDAL